PGPPPANDPTPVHLSPLDRGLAGATFDQMAQSIAGYEASAEVTPFTSKFDAVLAGKAQFTAQEQMATTCSAARRNATPVTVTADRERPRCSRTSPPAILEPLPIRGFLTMGKIGPTRWALSPIPQGRHTSTTASAIFSPTDMCSATPPQWMHDGSS